MGFPESEEQKVQEKKRLTPAAWHMMMIENGARDDAQQRSLTM